MRLRWTDHALADLEELSERAPGQAGTVYDAVNWLARQRFPNLGRDVPELDRADGRGKGPGGRLPADPARLPGLGPPDRRTWGAEWALLSPPDAAVA